jgi:hypothetical protein
MKKKLTLLALLVSGTFIAQENKHSDTSRVNMGELEILIVDHSKDTKVEQEDTLTYVTGKQAKFGHKDAHWSGVDFGFRVMFNDDFSTKFPNNIFLENNVSKSTVWNINFLERKVAILQNHLGFTTGLGLNFASYAFNNNYILNTTGSSISATTDTVYTYTKNNLNATYLMLPLMLEFCGNKYEEEGFYISAGLVGGVKIYSRIHRQGSFDGKTFDESIEGDYSINPFILNTTVRLGFNTFGLFVDYSLLNYFKANNVANVHPLTFGLSLNF